MANPRLHCPALSVERPRQRPGRWLAAAVLIFGVHVSGAALGMMQWRDPVSAQASLPAAIMIDLAPVAVTPPPPPMAAPRDSQLADEPVAISPESIDLPPLAELRGLPKYPDIAPEMPFPAKAEQKKQKKQKTTEATAERKEKPKADKKKTPTKKADKKKEDQVLAAAKIVAAQAQDRAHQTAGDTVTATRVEVTQSVQQASLPEGSGDAVSRAADPAASALAQASWESLVVAHIAKFKKYPRAAKRRNHEGMPVVAFVVDRAGNIRSIQLARSSGHDSLDEEALATLRRAEPLPPIPPEMAGATISRSVPIRFNLKN